MTNLNSLTYGHDAFAGFIGVARRDITPPSGIYNRNWGAAMSDIATGIHRPLTATALALKREANDVQPLVLLTLDLGWWRTIEDEWEVRGAILDALNADESRLLLHLTHTHAGPSLCRHDADRPGGHLVGPYLDRVKTMCVEAAREAVHNATPATLDWVYGKCTLARNRDLPDPDAPRIVCGFNPGLPADDTLLVGRVTDAHGKLIATLVNYACHPVTLAWENTLISPDFVGAMREMVETQTHHAPCLFLQGASGELAPLEEYTGNTAIADKNGRILGHAVRSVLEGMLPAHMRLRYNGVVESGAPLATWALEAAQSSNRLGAAIVKMEVALKSTLPALAEIETQLTSATDGFMIERWRRRRHLRRAVGDGQTSMQRAWVWRIGDAVLVANPNEAYSQLQIELRRRFADRTVGVLNITNGAYAYMPPREMYDRDQYQVWQTPYERGCLEQLIEACTQAVEQVLQ
jgi:hypothetical protein